MSDRNLWVITTDERVKHDAQFQFLKPTNGYITGDQVKFFFLKSGLPPAILGQIWSLADMDEDGKLNKKEFSIAMFLIKKKLEGMQLPVALPETIKDDPQPVFVSSLTAAGNHNATSVASPNPANNGTHSGKTENGIIDPNLSETASPNSSTTLDSHAWSIESTCRPKYRLLFIQHDRSKRGYITGVEARGIFLQFGLSQQILAHIWTLADLNKDGTLDIDEFCIAMFLIEKAIAGVQLPPNLPASLLPTLMRAKNQQPPNQQSGQAKNEEANKISALSFEDKRRENFRQGQVELDRRKQELAEKMRQEEEARVEKERQERERQEQIKLEKERQKAVEAERHAERLRELEAQREVRRRQAVEARTQSWRAAEAQRQIEAERQRVEALQKEKSHVHTLLEQAIAHRASLQESASSQEQRKRELETRHLIAVSEVDTHKATITEMRDKRDMYERDIRELTEQVEAAKAELSRWQREREQLSLRLATGVDTNPMAEQCKTLMANSELRRTSIENLNSQLVKLDESMTGQGQDLASRRNTADELSSRTIKMQMEVMELRDSLRKKIESHRGTAYASSLGLTNSEKYAEYEVMFDFDARHPDELSLITGTVVRVDLKPNVTVASGWFYGESNGQKGLFPESYVRKRVTGKIDPFDPFGVHKANVSSSGTVQKEPSPNPVFSLPKSKPIVTSPSSVSESSRKPLFTCVALYPFESAVAGDLNLAINDVVHVQAIRDEWWEGVCERTKLSGLFPANYTRKLTQNEEKSVLKNSSLQNPPAEPPQVAWPDFTVKEPLPPAAPILPPDSPTTSAPSSPVTVESVPINASTGVVVSTKPEFARVIAPYTATSAGQLSLQAGQVVQLRKRSNKGWWEGELQQRGRVRQYGWFPADYVKLISPSSVNGTNGHMSASGKTRTSHSGDNVTSRSPSVPANTVNPVPAPVPVKTSTSSPIHATVSAPTQSTVQPNVPAVTPATNQPVEMMQAIFSYKAAHADELTFEEGSIITVLGRDEPEWWRGRLQSSGVEGLFPVNYVRSHNPLAPGGSARHSVQRSLVGAVVSPVINKQQ